MYSKTAKLKKLIQCKQRNKIDELVFFCPWYLLKDTSLKIELDDMEL